MLSASVDPEMWLRGAVEGYEPLLMPVVHALLQVRVDLERLRDGVPHEHVWQRPGGAASIGYHVRHTGGALDRLFTYARGESLDESQRAALKREGEPGTPPASIADEVARVNAIIDRALAQLRSTSRDTLLDPRQVGRANLPSTVLGLLFHAPEHSTRHMGQAITTALIVRGDRE
jgi:hypothetical protein